MPSHTEIETFHRCPREHHYRYVRRREPVTRAKALDVGVRLEGCIKRWHMGAPVSLAHLEPEERALVKGYMAYYQDQAFRMERVDVRFKVRLGAVEMIGDLDGLGREEGRGTIYELKSTSIDVTPGSDYWRKIGYVDPQATLYLKAAGELGLADPWLTWDAVHKTALRQGKKETPEEYEDRVLGDIAKRPTYYFQRQTITRTEEEHQAHIRDLNGTVHLIQTTRAMGGLPPRNVDACFHFHRPCNFFAVCSGETSIDDPTRYQDSQRPDAKPLIQRPPEHQEIPKYDF